MTAPTRSAKPRPSARRLRRESKGRATPAGPGTRLCTYSRRRLFPISLPVARVPGLLVSDFAASTQRRPRPVCLVCGGDIVAGPDPDPFPVGACSLCGLRHWVTKARRGFVVSGAEGGPTGCRRLSDD